MTSVNVPSRLFWYRDAFAVGGDEQIGPAVVVVIADGDAHPEASAGHTGFFRHIGEGAVAIVLVQRVAERLRRA